MMPSARWTHMDSPVKPANDEGVGGVGVCVHHPTGVTLRLDRRVHLSVRALGADGFAGQAGG